MITSLLTNFSSNSVLMTEFRQYLFEHLRIEVANHITQKNTYRSHWRSSKDLITWGIKWKSHQYKQGGRNVLYCENAQIKQNQGIYVDSKGYFSDSSIVLNKEYDIEPSDKERQDLRDHIAQHYKGHLFGDYSYDPDGPILIPMQMNKDATMRHYFPLCKSTERIKHHLDFAIQHLPKGTNAIVRSHPKEKNFPDCKIPNYFHIESSGNIQSVLKKCSGVVAVNSTVVTEALLFGLPVATLGRNIFTGSKCVLDCSGDPEKIRDILKFKPKMKDIENYLCAVMRRQLPYDSTIENTLKNPSIQEWLQVVAQNDDKRPINFDMGKSLPKPKNKSKVVIVAGKHEPRRRKPKPEDIIPAIHINYHYDIALISPSRAGRNYVGSIIKNHPQIDASRVGIFDILDPEIEGIINNTRCKKILLFKENLFENYVSHYIWKRCGGNSEGINSQFKIDEYTCMRWIVANREAFVKLQAKMSYCIPFFTLNEEKINDLFNNLEVAGLLSMSPNTKKCPFENKKDQIRNYEAMENQIQAKIGVSIWSEDSAGKDGLTHCGNCHNETIDKASKLNRCLHCGQRN